MQPFSKHLSIETLSDIAEGQMDVTQNGAARSHLAECEECRMAVHDLKSIILAMQTHELALPPQNVTQRAMQIFRPQEKPAAGSIFGSVSALQAGLQSLVALLRFDSGLTPVYGMRGGRGQARQLFYTVDEFDIDLRLAPGAGEWTIEGQLLGGNTAGTAELESIGHRYNGDLNELGEFAFAGVRPDSYRLRITLPGLEISVPELVLTK
jgi:hypothetical protein